MSAYKIFETNNYKKEINKHLSTYQQRIIEKKLATLVYPHLKLEPHYGPHIKKLKNYTPESYRYRLGVYRLFYAIDENKKIVVMTAFRPRSKAYR